MKKIQGLILSAAMLLSLTACTTEEAMEVFRSVGFVPVER